MGVAALGGELVARRQPGLFGPDRSRHNSKRRCAVVLASNVLWVVWAIYTRSWALVFLQVCLAAMNIRGAKKAEPAG